MTTLSDRNCPTHGPYTAKVVEILGREIASPCPHCAKAMEDREARRKVQDAEQAKARRIEGLYARSCIPLRFQSRNFGNYEAKGEGQERAKRIAQAYADEWPTMRERGTCLILSGKPGTGKTHLACAIANQVINQHAHSALFTTVSDALRTIKRAYGKDADTSEIDAINELVSPSLLILDEVGMAYDTDHSKTLIFDLMNKRYEQVRPSIVLTNLDAAALREHLGDRITDRLREGGGRLVSFTWESGRA
jgi:DNA replication protein DnaC